jgi:CheY-like chemotaxis protein
MTETLEDFADALSREEWYYVFSGHGLHEKIKPLMDKAVFSDGKKPPLALMVEWGTEAHIEYVRFVSLPIQSLSIANVLNGKTDSRDYFNSPSSGSVRFTYPSARLLIVDDISTNLKVAEGLLAPYRAKIDTSLTGTKAIELVKQNAYDIVFMDHMMPDMDGIEATAIIRAWEKEQGIDRPTVPIIALTANAISGMKEMYIENGFNDFLAKPIDVSKLDETLAKWISKAKRGVGSREWGVGNKNRSLNNDTASVLHAAISNNDPHSPLPTPHSLLPGIDIQHGISMTGGTLELYRQVIGLFRRDAEERLALLQTVPDSSALPAFITLVHALKSASASIGAAEVSARAAHLEAAGKDANFEFIRENLPGFAQHLADIIDRIRAWEGGEKEQNVPTGEHGSAALTRLFHELAAALEAQKAGDIDRILEELNAHTTSASQTIDAETKEILDKISDNVLMAEYANAAKIARSLLKI